MGHWRAVTLGVGLSADLRGFAAVAALAALGPMAVACPLPAAMADEQRMVHGAVQLAWKTEPDRLAVGRPFALLVQLCPVGAQVLRVDASMPEHRHGMNYRPSVKALGEGRWRVEGLLWHMAGRWELAVEVESSGERLWLKQSVHLP